MNFEIIKELEKEQLKAEVPQFATGDTVRVHNRIKEGTRERVQIFEGTVIKIQGGGARTTFTVRKISNGIGVEKTWPIHSPNVEAVDVVRRGKVRRAKLFYLRGLSGKKAKVKARKIITGLISAPAGTVNDDLRVIDDLLHFRFIRAMVTIWSAVPFQARHSFYI